MPGTIELSLPQARELALVSQGLHPSHRFGTGLDATLKTIEQLSYIQIDSISVIQRAHHHCLYSRLPSYQPEHLAQLVAKKQVFEYWSHAAAYLPMQDYRFTLPKKQAIAAGEKHWRDKNPQAEKRVLQRIQQEGPLQAKDFAPAVYKKSSGWWDWKPDKVALEQLFIEGKLMVAERKGFQKVYDLAERILPQGLDTSIPSQDEFNRHLVTRYLKAHALGSLEQIVYLRKGIKTSVAKTCAEMLENNELTQLSVANNRYFAQPNCEDLLKQSIAEKQLRILSPFDNLVIQRKRLAQLFNFDYQIECYVPADKRQYGYFSLPLLWGAEFVGRMDCKVERTTQVLHIHNLHIETATDDSLLEGIHAEVLAFSTFNGAKSIKLHKVSGVNLQLQSFAKKLTTKLRLS